ncbi:MAG: DMT family transporter [Silicimonas sp.]|nr:DMT family transporter [Silicimonas sp.]
MVAAMAGFAVEDMALKRAASGLPAWQVMVLFGAGGALAFLVAARLRAERVAPPEAFRPTMLIRDGFEISGRLFYTLAYIHAPLAFATVVLQATPLVVVAGAALFFGETVGWRRWTAILVGFLGVALMIRPDTGGVGLVPAIFAILGMLGFAGRDLATRAAPPALGPAALGVWGFLAILVAGAIWSQFEQRPPVMPDAAKTLWLALAIGIGAASYTALTLAMRTGEIAAVAPFRYTRILFGVGFGVLVFGETLDRTTLLGAVIVVASGLYILFRSRRSNGL